MAGQIEKMKNILASVNIESDAKNAEEIYNRYITESYVVNISGQKLKNLEAFSVNLKKELAKINKINNLNNKVTVRKRSPFSKFMASIISFREKDKSEIKEEISKSKVLPFGKKK